MVAVSLRECESIASIGLALSSLIKSGYVRQHLQVPRGKLFRRFCLLVTRWTPHHDPTQPLGTIPGTHSSGCLDFAQFWWGRLAYWISDRTWPNDGLSASRLPPADVPPFSEQANAPSGHLPHSFHLWTGLSDGVWNSGDSSRIWGHSTLGATDSAFSGSCRFIALGGTYPNFWRGPNPTSSGC